MSSFYSPTKTRGLYDPKSKEPYRISRSKIDLFVECPRCFYLDQRLGVKRPPGFPFNLNTAVDHLLKKEFDAHRLKQTAHPFMKAYKIDAVPFAHEKMDDWRDSLSKGVMYLHEPTNLMVRGGVDDIWVNPKGELIVVDYKATSKAETPTLDADWQNGYKRQMEVYQWLLRQSGFKVNKTGYFVYCNGKKDSKAFDKKLEFDVILIPYKGDPSWIEPTLESIKKTLNNAKVPKASGNCDYCRYRDAVAQKLGSS